MAPQTSSGWDFSKIDQSVNRIEKLKLTSRDGIINDKDMPPYTHGTIRMQNIGVKAGESFTLRPESITYTDPDKTSKTIDTTTNSYGKNVQVVEKPLLQRKSMAKFSYLQLLVLLARDLEVQFSLMATKLHSQFV